jgi:hypothetical protein
LSDVGRRYYIVRLIVREVMSVGRVLCSSDVIIILYPKGIFITENFWSDGFDLMLLNEL